MFLNKKEILILESMLNGTSVNVDLHVSIMLEVRLLKAINSRTALFLSLYTICLEISDLKLLGPMALKFFSRDEVKETTRT